MSDQPFVGEMFIFGCNFAPLGYALCQGQLLSISSNTALFSLLGTTYGGNGVTTFGLPDLRGRAAMHVGQGPGLSPYSLGQVSGTNTVTLTANQMPVHTHAVQSNNGDGTLNSPVNNVFAGPGADRDLYWYDPALAGTTVNMNVAAVSAAGSNQPHNNMMPYLGLNFCIATTGIYPSRN